MAYCKNLKFTPILLPKGITVSFAIGMSSAFHDFGHEIKTQKDPNTTGKKR